MDVEQPLLLFRLQYLQCIDPELLKWPSSALLKQEDAQRFISRYLLDDTRHKHLPSETYRIKVLEGILKRIGNGLDSHDNRASNELQLCLENLRSGRSPHASAVMQQDLVVTYNCVPQASDLQFELWRPARLLETRSLNLGSQVTGYRTWEGALHLGSFLVSTGASIIENKSVLELGAGTGFVSILCAKYLSAKRVMATDGDEMVVEALRKNFDMNELGPEAAADVLWWGNNIQDTKVELPYDVVLGADIIYDREAVLPLIETLGMIFEACPKVDVIMSAVIRRLDTFQTFRDIAAPRKERFHAHRYQLSIDTAVAAEISVLLDFLPISTFQTHAPSLKIFSSESTISLAAIINFVVKVKPTIETAKVFATLFNS